MDRKQALKKLDALEKETEELRKIIEKDEDDNIPSLMKRVKTYSDLCRIKGLKELTEADFDHLPKEKRRKALLFNILQDIYSIFGFKPDWKNKNQYKWRPYFERTASEWCFYCSFYYCYGSIAAVGYCEEQSTSDWVGKIFLKEHTEFIEIQ